ncbi:MAG: hypothetical protein HY330_06230 [Chloroflexi bacterium]|nr:hypothetical protein [Chloroflexota bacterium]
MSDKREARRQLIALARRLQRPGSGTSLRVLRERTADMQFPDLRPILGPLPWAVAGAVATRLYMPERATRDLDIAVLRRDRAEAERKLTGAGFTRQSELAIGGSTWLSPDGTPVDVVELEAPWAAKAIVEAQNNRDSQGLPVLPLPYLVLMKLQAGRVQDLADVTRMLGQADEGVLNATRQLFERHAPEDLDDLESLIALGQLEMRNP